MPRPESTFESNRASFSSDATQSVNLDAAAQAASRRAQHFESQITQLEEKLAEDLSNSRAVNNLLTEVVHSLQTTQRRSKTALTATVPHIAHSLSEDMDALNELGDHLPQVGKQVNHIRAVYDHGRFKAQQLSDSLDWLNTPVPSRLWTIIFTPNAPVSQRWKALIRLLFALTFLACTWIAFLTVRGAIRAHRQRLVWGERLMS